MTEVEIVLRLARLETKLAEILVEIRHHNAQIEQAAYQLRLLQEQLQQPKPPKL